MPHEMTTIAEIKIPPILKIGGSAFATAAALIHRLGGKRPLIVTDPFFKTQLADRLATQIRDAGLSCEIFHETVPDPTTTVVDAGVRRFVEGAHDSLVSLGGGSPIDTAKAIGMLAANGGGVRDYRVPNEIPLAGPPHLAMPTTAGTGSEVTRFTVITDVERGEKLLLAGDTLLPSAAVVDYELTLSMPARLTADSGTDSLTHAIEAFVSRKANPFTDALALSAMKTMERAANLLPPSWQREGSGGHDARRDPGGLGVFQCKRSVGAWNEPAAWGSFSYSAWTLECHAAAGSHGLLGRGRTGPVCGMCSHHGRVAGA
jgi:alcohol dehydrogenase class IV